MQNPNAESLKFNALPERTFLNENVPNKMGPLNKYNLGFVFNERWFRKLKLEKS